MAVAKQVKQDDTFYKYMVDSPEVVEKKSGTYIHPLFFLVYYNLLNIYRIEEPNHHLLKEYPEVKRYYSHILKDESELPSTFQDIKTMAEKNIVYDSGVFYEEIEVENTFLLQLLIESYGKKYYSKRFTLSSRRKREYETTSVPYEIAPIFRILNIEETSGRRMGRPISFTGSIAHEMNPKIEIKGTSFHSVWSTGHHFSLAHAFSLFTNSLPFVSKDSVNKINTINPAVFQVVSGDRNYPKKTTGEPRQSVTCLDDVLDFVEHHKKIYFQQYEEVQIKKEITDFINSKITNKQKVTLAKFFNGSKQIVYPCTLTNGYRNFYSYTYQRTVTRYIDELRDGLTAHLFSMLQMDSSLASGCSPDNTDMTNFSTLRGRIMVYNNEVAFEKPDYFIPKLTNDSKEKAEQLTFLQEEGSPA